MARYAADGFEPMKPGNPKRRLANIKTNSGRPHLKVMYSLDCGEHARVVEWRTHKLLRDSRVSGEWFSVSAEEACKAVIEAVKELRLV